MLSERVRPNMYIPTDDGFSATFRGLLNIYNRLASSQVARDRKIKIIRGTSDAKRAKLCVSEVALPITYGFFFLEPAQENCRQYVHLYFVFNYTFFRLIKFYCLL